MVAVGIWGAFLGTPATWRLPVIFPIVMAFGAALAMRGIALPGVEMTIALSGAVLGLMVVWSARPPLWIASMLVGFFGAFHGYAHGTELPHAANAFTYAAGFVLATGLRHLGGIAVGQLIRWPGGRVAVRVNGGAIAATGFAFMFGLLQYTPTGAHKPARAVSGGRLYRCHASRQARAKPFSAYACSRPSTRPPALSVPPCFRRPWHP
jgi:urease accessory protein